MKVRGPDHPIVIAHTGRPVHVLADGEEIEVDPNAGRAERRRAERAKRKRK